MKRKKSVALQRMKPWYPLHSQPLSIQYILHNPTANPKTAAAPITIPKLSPTCAPAPCAPAPAPGALAARTCNPYPVATAAVPLTVSVLTDVAVVTAVQPAQLTHGGDVAQGPAVQPGQSEAGHALPSHHEVQGP